MLGEYKVRGQRSIEFMRGESNTVIDLVVTYLCRRDLEKKNVIKHDISKKIIQVDAGWQIVYVREYAVNEISRHDTAAMSPQTELSVNVVSLNTFKYSADTYIVAVIFPDDSVSQYCKINRSK